MIPTLALNKKPSEMHFKQIIKRFWVIHRFFYFVLVEYVFGVEKNVANSIELCGTFDKKFTLILRYFSVFFGIPDILDLDASVKRWTLDSGHCC